MSQPNTDDALAEARKLYEEALDEVRWDRPHTGAGECSSDCGKTMDCPLDQVGPFEEWLEQQELDAR